MDYQGVKHRAMFQIQLTEDVIACTLLASASGYSCPLDDEGNDSYVFNKTKKGYRAVRKKKKNRRRTDGERASG